jgi:hypothetical protein
MHIYSSLCANYKALFAYISFRERETDCYPREEVLYLRHPRAENGNIHFGPRAASHTAGGS